MSGDDNSWTSTFDDAERFALKKSRSVTPEERLEWLEQAQAFAVENGLLSSLESVTPSDEQPISRESAE